MKKRIFESILGVILSSPFLAAESVVPNLSLELSKTTWYAIGALLIVLVLILIYWFLQSRYNYS